MVGFGESELQQLGDFLTLGQQQAILPGDNLEHHGSHQVHPDAHAHRHGGPLTTILPPFKAMRTWRIFEAWRR